jgi:hypothetical protein
MFNPDNMDGAQTMPFADLFGGALAPQDDFDNNDENGKKKEFKAWQEEITG